VLLGVPKHTEGVRRSTSDGSEEVKNFEMAGVDDPTKNYP
jgi:hypothetical protein